MGLEQYRAKRDFKRTPEPAGEVGQQLPPSGRRFIVQKHAARRLHYDFRLELDGVLKSWAVTRGPSLDPRDKRLAVEVEDHPLEYGDFEGIIPKGEYGGGTVMLWDRGTWEPVGDAEKGLAEGMLKFRLTGEKLAGGWALVRLKDDKGGRKNWLLVKERDDEAREGVDLLAEEPRSVKSHRDIDEIAAEPGDVWSGSRSLASRQPGAKPGPLPQSLEPQLASPVAEAPGGDGWLHEIKYDGYRLLCRIDNGKVRMITRGGKDWTEKFAALARAAGTLPCAQAIVDGEAVILGPSGASDFGALQAALSEGRDRDMTFMAFDLVHLDGIDLTGSPLEARKSVLADLLAKAPANLQFSDHIAGRGPEVRRRACAMAAEGVVSKRRDRPYRAGRSRDWLKSKCIGRDEFVVGGFTASTSSKKRIGALLLGVWDNGQLRYAGKVGTGFSEAVLADLEAQLSAVVRPQPAFVDPPAERATWTEPSLVIEVDFAEWTRDGHLRHPVFRGVRADKDPAAVTRQAMLPAGAGSKTDPRLDEHLQRFRFTHPDRVLWPGQGITKRGLAEYYVQVAPWMLPHVTGRPLSLVRCPQGEGKECFFQRHAGNHLDRNIKTVPVPGDEPTLWIADIDGLLALVQMGVLEIHQWGCRVEDIEKPDRLCFDLDPDPELPWTVMVEAAREVRQRLVELGLTSFLKTTGGKGLHLVVPIQPQQDWDEVKAFCKALAERLARERPDRYVATITKARRVGRIFIDYLRNQRAASFIAPFSTRAWPGAPLSVPLSWDELDVGVRSDHYRLANIGRRLAVLDRDPWEGVGDLQQSITPQARQSLGL